LTIANLGTIIANLSAIKITANMFNLPSIPLLITMICLAFVFVSKGNYRTNQNIFLITSFFYISYIISAIKARPDWSLALKSMFIPTNISLTKEFVFAAIAVLGTTITPWGQFFVHSYILDKKIHGEKKLRYAQIETIFGAFLTDFFSFFMIVATAATLFINNISLTSGEAAALAIKPFAGELASVLFALGILNAGFMGSVIVSLTTAYAFSEFFGYEGSLDKPFHKSKQFYSLFMIQMILAGLVVILPGVSLFQIVFFTQSFNGILLPLIFYFLLKITNNKKLMGKYTNNNFYNYFAIISSIIIVGASLFTIISNLLHW
jgi:Mn2+/Fe2+ NRAMP family transporter